MALTRKSPVHLYVLVLLDWLTIVGSMVAAILLRGRDLAGEFTLFGAPVYWEVIFISGYGLVVVFVFHYFNLYRSSVFISVADHTVRIVKALMVAVLGIGLLAFFIRADFILDSRLAIIYFTILSFALMLGGRVVVYRAVYLFLSRHHVFHRKAIILGSGGTAKTVAINIFLSEHLGLTVAGFLDDELPVGRSVFNEAKVLGRLSELPGIVQRHGIDEVLVCLEGVDQTRFIQELERAIDTGVTVKVSSPLYDVVPARMDMEKYGSVAVVGVSQFGPSPAFEMYKRVFDSVVAAVTLVLLTPVFVAIALAIRFDSRGPVFFRQTRIGKDGRPFQFYKFRSMRSGGDRESAREDKYAALIRGEWQSAAGDTPTKIVDESRVTSIGRMLRRTSLDELPQLYNVLRGDMSLVGPRPCLPYEWKHYEEWHKRRLSVTPGCTGLWQVVGRSQVGFQDMVILDLFYSQNASFHLDLWLLMKTIPVMVLGKGGR